MEITLDEMVLNAHDSLCSTTYGFYKNNPLNSTDDILSRLPSVSMIRRGNYAWEPTLNGLSGGQVNVAIDGMRMFGACTDKMDPVSSYVEPNNLESIQVEKGSSGNEFGSSVGGSVAFKLKRPRFNSGWSGGVGTRYESVSNGFSQTASLNYGKEKFAIRANGSYRNYQDYTDGTGQEVFPSGYEKTNLSLAGSYRIKNTQIVSVDLLIDNAYDVGYPGLPMDVAFAKAKMAAMSYVLWEPTPHIEQLEIKGYVNSIDHLMDDSKRADVPVRMDMPGRTQTFGAYAVADLKRLQKHKIKVKLDWYETLAYADMTMFIPNEIDMFMITWGDIKRSDLGLFATDNISLSKKLLLNVNVRMEYATTDMTNEMARQQFSVFGYSDEDYTSTEVVINSGAALSYSLSKKLNTTLNLSYGERLPSSSEQFGFYLYNSFDGFDYIGNPNIRKEKSTQVSASLDYTIDNKLQINLDGFYYWFDDYILGLIDENLDAMTIGGRGVKVYQNLEGVTYKGFNAEVVASPSTHFQFLYNLKATYADDGEGMPLPLIPPLKSYLTLIGQVKGYKLQLEGEWSSAQDRINAEAGEQATDSYLLAHMRLNKTFDLKNTKLSTSLGVENIFDQDYRDHMDWGGILRPGRNFYASLNFSF